MKVLCETDQLRVDPRKNVLLIRCKTQNSPKCLTLADSCQLCAVEVVLDDVAGLGLSLAHLTQVSKAQVQVITEHDHGTGDEFLFEGNRLDSFECGRAYHAQLGLGHEEDDVLAVD